MFTYHWLYLFITHSHIFHNPFFIMHFTFSIQFHFLLTFILNEYQLVLVSLKVFNRYSFKIEEKKEIVLIMTVFNVFNPLQSVIECLRQLIYLISNDFLLSTLYAGPHWMVLILDTSQKPATEQVPILTKLAIIFSLSHHFFQAISISMPMKNGNMLVFKIVYQVLLLN